jgi:hypothetical protein
MAKKGFKLPGVTPLKQTGSTSGSFFQPLNPRLIFHHQQWVVLKL